MTIIWLVLIVVGVIGGFFCGARYGYNLALESARTEAGESELGPEWVSRKSAGKSPGLKSS